jgi:peroxin-1
MAVHIYLVTLGSQSESNVLLLTTNTEVSIAPKPHRSRGPTSSISSTSSSTTAQTTDTSPPKETNNGEDALRQNAQILRVLPQRILSLPYSEYNGSELTAYVSPSTFSQLKPSHKFTKNAATIACFQTVLKRLPPPVDPSLSISASSPPPVTRILKPEAADKVNHGDDGASGSVFVGWADGIPENHIVFPAFPDSVEEWDLVQ